MWSLSCMRSGLISPNMMRARTASCMSLYLKRQGTISLRGAGIFVIICLLLSVVCVDAYRGVVKCEDSIYYNCETWFFNGSNTREKMVLSNFRTEKEAALACDVVFYYTNVPSEQFNLEFSEESILKICKPRYAYENLHTWNDRREFITNEVKVLMKALESSSEDVEPTLVPPVPELRWENIVIPPSVSKSQAEETAQRIVNYFWPPLPDRLPVFMAWLMDPSNQQQILQEVLAQIPSQQERGAQESQLHIDEVWREQEVYYDVSKSLVTLLLQTRPVWISFLIGNLPLIFKLFEKANSPSTLLATVRSPEDEKHLIWTKLQSLRQTYLKDMIQLYELLVARSKLQPAGLQAEQLQWLEIYMDVVDRIISDLQAPQDPIPNEFNLDKVDAFEKYIVKMMEIFKRTKEGVNP